MSREADLLQTLRECPDDLAARLVFADWLEERGDARGELVRLQAELAAWVPQVERRLELQRRERAWLNSHASDWVGGLADVCDGWRIEGGLLHVTFLARAFAAGGDVLAEHMRRAWVRTVRLLGTAKEVAKALASPALAAVTALDLSGLGVDDDGLEALTESPHVASLRELDLSNNALSGKGVGRLLAQDAWAERLTALDVRHNHIVYLGLPKGWALGRRRLDLFGNDLSPASRKRVRALREPVGPRRLTNSLGMELVLIPAGELLMGSPAEEDGRHKCEGPQHHVTLTRPFYLGAYLVTQAQYEQVMGDTPSQFEDGGPWRPVDRVNWSDAVDFCARLSALPEEKAAGRTYRLATEAEWEHACRAGAQTPFHFGDDPDLLPEHAWFARNSGQHTHPVGLKRPNAWGLYDMHGNLWEWTASLFGRYRSSKARVDPVGAKRGRARVMRGGSWHNDPSYCRCAYRTRDDIDPEERDNDSGFRVALDAPGP
jgi:uncharacterized protein (TIGR02996 family)